MMCDLMQGVSRRKFLGQVLGVTAVTAFAGYPVLETRHLIINRLTVSVPRLPEPLSGLKIAFLADTHVGPFLSTRYLRQVVNRVNSLGADLIALGGDYVHRESRYVASTALELARLSAPLGVFSILGNHDYYAGRVLTLAEFAKNKIPCLVNSGQRITRGTDSFWLGGVDDLCRGNPQPGAALHGVEPGEAVILLSHSPDVAETLDDERVGLMLSGHTHGGQVRLPLIGSPIIPSQYGQKYASGLVKAPKTNCFVTRGVGTVFPPVRLNCPPEIALLTLTA
jgi:predicted MPP superfamily phosphohydrolase